MKCRVPLEPPSRHAQVTRATSSCSSRVRPAAWHLLVQECWRLALHYELGIVPWFFNTTLFSKYAHKGRREPCNYFYD